MSECHLLMAFYSFFSSFLSLSSSLLFVTIAAGTMDTIELQMNAPQEQTFRLSRKVLKSLMMLLLLGACIALHLLYYRQTWQLNNLIGFYSLSNDALFEYEYQCVCCLLVISASISYARCGDFKIHIDTIIEPVWNAFNCTQCTHLARLYPAH